MPLASAHRGHGTTDEEKTKAPEEVEEDKSKDKSKETSNDDPDAATGGSKGDSDKAEEAPTTKDGEGAAAAGDFSF